MITLFAIFLLIGLVLLGGWFFYYRRYGQKAAPQLPLTQTELEILKLQPKISWCKFLEHVGEYGKNLSLQYQLMIKILNSSQALLKQKFSTQEITYMRYQQAIDSANQLLLDNVTKIIPLVENLDHIAASDLTNEQALVQKIEALHQLNAQLIEKLNELIINLSQLKNLTGPDQQTTLFLLDNLDNLIERAKHY